MIDKDQHLLWEAYMAEKSDNVASRTEPKDKLNKGDFLPKKVRDEINKKDGEEVEEEAVEEEDEEVQEEMDNLEFSAQDRISMHDIEYKLQQTFVDAAADWIIADAEALTTPEDYEGYSMSTAFDNAKDFIKDVLQDLPFSDVKRQVEDRNGMILDPEEAAFQASVDDDIRRDDSRLSDMPPREPGI
jgi:hypothetical protein